MGYTDITFLIVNHVMGAASINELTRRVSFPVYQDDYNLHIQSKLNASIDDLFLYDRYNIVKCISHHCVWFKQLPLRGNTWAITSCLNVFVVIVSILYRIIFMSINLMTGLKAFDVPGIYNLFACLILQSE